MFPSFVRFLSGRVYTRVLHAGKTQFLKFKLRPFSDSK